MTTIYMGLFKDFQRAQNIGSELSRESDVSLADIAVIVNRDAPTVFDKYVSYFDLEQPADESDEEESSLLEDLNPFSGDDEEDELTDPNKRNRTIICIRDDGNYDADAIRSAMQSQSPIALTEEDDEAAWLGDEWRKNAETGEDIEKSETIQDRRYRSFNWQEGEQR